MKDYFFKPYNPEGEVAIKELSDIFERNGFDEKQSMLLARYLVEPRD